MRIHWSATLAFLTLVGLLVTDAAAQQDQRDASRTSRQQARQLDDEEVENDDEDDDRYEMDDDDEHQGDRDDDRYTTQYGNDHSRTSRDYSLDRNNEYATERSNRSAQRRSSARDNRSSGTARGEADFERDNNDAPHSSTRTDRRNRFDDETSRFEDDEYASRSYQPDGDRSANRTQRSTHDYSQGLWSRAFRPSERSQNRSADDSDDSDNAGNQTWSEWWSSRMAGDGETHGEASERFASSADEFIRQHDDDEDTYLSRREMPRAMLENFHDLDVDGDDYLSRNELQQHARNMRQALPQRTPGESSASGQAGVQVIPVEVTYVWIMDADRGQVRLHDLQGAYDLLQRIDANNDGNITRSELRERREHVVSRWIEHGFDRLDENEDDAISRREAENSMLQERFDRLDANEDGELTRGELRRSAQNASQTWGPQDEDAYLSESDDEESRR